MKRNEERANRISRVFAFDYDPACKASSITDILADIRHFCDWHDIDFHEHLDRSYDHYSAELREEED